MLVLVTIQQLGRDRYTVWWSYAGPVESEEGGDGTFRSEKEAREWFQLFAAERGFRPEQIGWQETELLPDIREQSAVIASREVAEADVLDFLDHVADRDGWR